LLAGVIVFLAVAGIVAFGILGVSGRAPL